MATLTASPDDFDAYAEVTIHHKVDALIGRYGYLEQDREDLEQDLRLWVLERLDGFVPEKVQRTTFISRVVDQRIADLIRARRRACRDRRRESCLRDNNDAPTNDLDQLPGHAAVRFAVLELRIDVRDALQHLNQRQQEICSLLVEHSQETVKKMLGLPRRAFDADVSTIRDSFGRAGLDGYVN